MRSQLGCATGRVSRLISFASSSPTGVCESIVGPGIVEERQHALEIPTPGKKRQRMERDAGRARRGLGSRHALGQARFRDPADIGDEIHRLDIAQRLDMAGVMRRSVIGSHDMGLVESFDEKAALVVDRQTEGAARDRGAVTAQKRLHRAEQPGEHGAIIDPLKKSEEAASITEFGDVPAVDRRHDPPDRLAVAEGDEGLDDVLAQEGRPARIECHANLLMNGLDPARISRLRPPGGRDERVDSAPVRDRPNFDPAHGGLARADGAAAAFGSSSAVSRTASSICAVECSELMKNLSRASRSGMAG